MRRTDTLLYSSCTMTLCDAQVARGAGVSYLLYSVIAVTATLVLQLILVLVLYYSLAVNFYFYYCSFSAYKMLVFFTF